MLDIKFIRKNADLVRDGAVKKHIQCDVDSILAIDEVLRAAKFEAESLKAEQNAASKRIATLPGEEKKAAIDEMKAIAARQKAAEVTVKEKAAALHELLLQVPNPPAPEVPDGADDTENVELRRHGNVRQFEFEPKDHVELAELHDMLDVERATRIAGSRTYFLRNMGALLELSILRLSLDHMVSKGFTPSIVPNLVRHEAMSGTAYFPGGEEQTYCVEKDELYLIGTAEVPLTSFHAGEILDEGELPIKLCGWSNCYRREAGAAGRDTRGLYRIHQFQKVEQVIVATADEEQSKEHHEFILQNAEEVLQMLELPYRVVNVCGGDLGRGQIQKYDIETWMPSRNSYSETHSASRFHAFQSRRLNLRYREANGDVHFCHTLNNTVIASPRALIPLLENHQNADGSIHVPEALRPYLNGIELLELPS